MTIKAWYHNTSALHDLSSICCAILSLYILVIKNIQSITIALSLPTTEIYSFYLLYVANRYCLYDDTEQSFSWSNIPNINNVHVFKVAFLWLPNKTRTNVCVIPKLTSTELDVLFIEHISSLLYQIYPREKFYVK